MAQSCLFCRIVGGELPGERLYEDDEVIIIRDIAPAAPQHLLVIPRRHLGSLNEVGVEDEALLGRMVLAAVRQARDQGLTMRGYRLVMNCGRDAGQGVEHLHLHVLGGRQLGPIA